MDGAWTLEPSEEAGAPARVELTWTPERIERLIALWEEGVTTAEIGRRIGVTKNAVIASLPGFPGTGVRAITVSTWAIAVLVM